MLNFAQAYLDCGPMDRIAVVLLKHSTNLHEKTKTSIFRSQIVLARDSNSNLPAEKWLKLYAWFGPSQRAGGCSLFVAFRLYIVYRQVF